MVINMNYKTEIGHILDSILSSFSPLLAPSNLKEEIPHLMRGVVFDQPTNYKNYPYFSGMKKVYPASVGIPLRSSPPADLPTNGRYKTKNIL